MKAQCPGGSLNFELDRTTVFLHGSMHLLLVRNFKTKVSGLGRKYSPMGFLVIGAKSTFLPWFLDPYTLVMGGSSPVLHTLSQHLRCCLSACTVSSEGHSNVLLSQLFLGDEEHDESSEFHGHKPTAAFLLL